MNENTCPYCYSELCYNSDTGLRICKECGAEEIPLDDLYTATISERRARFYAPNPMDVNWKEKFREAMCAGKYY